MNSNENAPSQLDLNPGPPSRKRASGTKCLLGGAAFFICLIIFSGLWLSIRNIYQAIYLSPHRSMYQNQTLEEVTNRSRVVRPLIDDDQTFDLAVTVWIKRSDAERQVYEAHHSSLVDTIQAKTGVDVMSDSRWVSLLQEQEKPVFSDVVFHGLKVSDKNIFADVNFTIPTAVFRDAKLTADHLRASVVLIPTSPSLLDHLTSYTHWLPAWSKGRPRLSYPFPLGSDNYKRYTLVDAAIDDIGIQFSLLRLVDVPSKCHVESNEYEEEDEDVSNELSVRNSDKIKHPYIETRTQLRVVDETHIFNRKAFDKAHRTLTKTANESDRDASQSARTYRVNGNWETRLELSIPDADSGTTTTEYAYAPYLAAFRSMLPDYLKVPVNRENCSGVSSLAEDQESMNITWHLSFTGRIPGKFVFADNSNEPSISIDQWHNASDHELATLHDSAVLSHGLFGHQFGKDAHPRRRLLASLLLSITSYIIWILDLHYWYTCISTVSISVPGYAMIAASGLLSAIIRIAQTARAKEQPGLLGWTWLLATTGTTKVLGPLLILKAITRGEFITRYKVIPWLRFSPPTHSERVSARIDARTPALVRAAVFSCLVAAWWLFAPQTIWLVPPAYPTAAEVKSPWNSASIVMKCFLLTGMTSQLILNHRTRVFAGSYKTLVFLQVFHTLVETLSLVQSLFGPIATRAGVSVSSLIDLAVLAVTVYQAVTLPSAVRTNEDEKGM